MLITKCKKQRASAAVILTLIFCMSVFTVFAAAEEPAPATLIIHAAWLDTTEGIPTIRIDVTDPETGAMSAIAVPLRDVMHEGDNSEFIAIQAIDLNGKQSGVIEIRNPFFVPNPPPTDTEDSGAESASTDSGESVSVIDVPAVNTNLRPFTPDGSSTVIDNAGDNDGKEFFTIFSDDGNEFFLIIDRHRNTDNVYFLNAVTEEDLMSLAQQAGREIENHSISAISTPPPVPDADEPENVPTPEPPQDNDSPTALGRIGNNLLVFGAIIAVVGGLAYYIKVVRPKKSGFSGGYGTDEPDDYDYDNAADMDVNADKDGDGY